MLQKLSSQLTTIEKDNSVNKLKKCVEELSAFIKELKSTTETNNAAGVKYMVEDIRAELPYQINDAIKNINSIFESLKTEFSIFNSLGDEIEELRKDITALKNDMTKNADINNEKPINILANIDRDFPRTRSYGYKQFVMSYRNGFNIRELLWILIIIAFVIKLIFFNHICE